MESGSLTSAIGGTSLSAGIADCQTQLNQSIGAGSGFGSDSVAQFAAAYRATGGGPTLRILGFNPFQVIATGAFHNLYWAVIVIFLGITSVVAMQRALIGRQTLSGRHPLTIVSQVYFRLMTGVLIIANTPLVYALLMTVNSVLSQGVQSMAKQSMTILLQTGSMGTLNMAEARIEAIRNAAARRTIALYPSGASRDEMIQIGMWYNATAGAINAALSARNLPGALPLLEAVLGNPQTPDIEVTSSIGRAVLQNFGQVVADLGALPADSGPMPIAFPEGGSTPLRPLSEFLAQDDARAAEAVSLPNTPASNAAFESARQLYGKNVLAGTLAYLDQQLLPVIRASPSLGQEVKAWFSEKIEQAAAAATGFMAQWRALVDWVGRGIGVLLARMVAFFFTAAIGVMIEVELFLLVIAVPLWLLPATEDAFLGILRSLASLSLVVPAYQFIMLFVDALMGLVLKYVMLGPLATGGGLARTAGGATYLVATAITVVGSGGDIVILAIFCYLVAYIFLAVYVAMKTPRLLAVFMKGAGAAGMFLSTFATGLISGATSALATAAVAGGGTGLAGRFLGGQLPARPARISQSADRGRASRSAATIPPRPDRSSLVSASMRAPPQFPREQIPVAPARTSERAGGAPRSSVPPASKLRETAAFGWRTFVDCLQADSPGDGVTIALRALDNHRKQKEKEAEAAHKARQLAAKSGIPAARKAPRKA